MKVKRIISTLSDTDIKYYESANPGWTVSKDYCLAISWDNGTSCTYVVFNGPFTLNNMCRDCGQYYELAAGGMLYNIEKETLEIAPVK